MLLFGLFHIRHAMLVMLYFCFGRREASAFLIMLSAKQCSHWYHFKDFGMTRPKTEPASEAERSNHYAIGISVSFVFHRNCSNRAISHLGFWSGDLFLIAPFPDLCLLVPFDVISLSHIKEISVLNRSRYSIVIIRLNERFKNPILRWTKFSGY